MRRFLTAGALAASMLAILGCCATLDATTRAAQGTIRDLRIIRAELVTQLPDRDVQIRDQVWTLRGLWDNRLGAMIARERGIVAGLAGDRSFDTKAVAHEEGVTSAPR